MFESELISNCIEVCYKEVDIGGNFLIPRTHRHLANPAFAIAAPSSWNSLPDSVLDSQNCSNFLSKLKTHYFIIAYHTILSVICTS